MNDQTVEHTHTTGSSAALTFDGSPTPIAGVPDFWGRVAAAQHVALFLDYDGTLAPFQLDRMMARPLTGVIDTLLGIINASRTFLYIVSGRPTDEIVHLAGDLRLTIVGSHGWERRDAEAVVTRMAISMEQERAALGSPRIRHRSARR